MAQVNGEFEVCVDCTIAIANDDYSGMDDATEKLVRAGIERLSAKHGWLVIGDEIGFTHGRCDCCGQGAGEKHACSALHDHTWNAHGYCACGADAAEVER